MKYVLISFSGIDGAGKSTQIEMLRSHIAEAGLRVRVLSFWDDAAVLKSLREAAGYRLFKGEKGVGTPEVPVRRQDKNVRSAPMTWLRMGTYVIDAISLTRKIRSVFQTGIDVVICDRFIYDELANLNIQNRYIDWYVRGLLRFVPTPQVSFVIDAEPAAARARKPEYPLQFLIENRKAYLLVSKLGKHFCVTRPGPAETVQAEVWKRVLQALNAAGLGREADNLKSYSQPDSGQPGADRSSVVSD